jgi:hypothetical protein
MSIYLVSESDAISITFPRLDTPPLWIGTAPQLSIPATTAGVYTLVTRLSPSNDNPGGSGQPLRSIPYRAISPERGVTNPRPVTVKKYQQSLRDLREHLACLESQLQAGCDGHQRNK